MNLIATEVVILIRNCTPLFYIILCNVESKKQLTFTNVTSVQNVQLYAYS
jgi:hypothetical protein